MEKIILDLGEYGSVVVEADSTEAEKALESGVVQAGLGDKMRQKLSVAAQESLQRTLQGIAHTLTNSLPNQDAQDQYQLDTFSVEFQLGFGVEAGVDAGITTKITPNGSFKCAYVWKQQEP